MGKDIKIKIHPVFSSSVVKKSCVREGIEFQMVEQTEVSDVHLMG